MTNDEYVLLGIRVKVAQKNFTVGDLRGNASKIIDTVKNSQEYSDIVVFSELCLSGYPPLDLLDSDRFIEDQLSMLKHILKETEDCFSCFVVGYIRKNESRTGKSLYNSLAVCYKGEIVYIYDKKLLPTYDVFDEDRYFESGDYNPPFYFKGKRIGFAICEDLWPSNRYHKSPIEHLYSNKCDFIISINASPSIIKKHENRLKLIQGHAKKYGIGIVYANQVGGNDDIVFDGNSFYVNNEGHIVCHGKSFQEDEFTVSIFDQYYGNTEEKQRADDFLEGEIDSFYATEAEFFCEQAVLGIRDYARKTGFSRIVIGESGGIDSAVTTAIAARALGPENVLAVTMPSRHSSSGSVEDSKELCDLLGVKLITIPIKEQYDAFMAVFNNSYGTSEPGVTEQNVQARIRGQILMAISNREGALVLSTGNKSELSVGFCSIYGDMSGGINPIADCYKMEVYSMGRYLGIPDSIMNKAPSAELADNQKDTDSLPPYPTLDTALRYFIEDEGDPIAIEELLNNFGWSSEKIYNMLRNAEFKRRQAALGIKMHKKAFGFGRRYPIVNKYHLNKKVSI
jgi:NAD+ synthase (glutamine-hydrolysing)